MKKNKRFFLIEITLFLRYFFIILVAYMIDNFISLHQIITPRKSQMTKVIHSDFLTLAKAMTSSLECLISY